MHTDGESYIRQSNGGPGYHLSNLAIPNGSRKYIVYLAIVFEIIIAGSTLEAGIEEAKRRRGNTAQLRGTTESQVDKAESLEITRIHVARLP